VNLEKGRKVAIAHIPASHGFPGLTASLIDEKVGGWKFDIPNTMTAEKLYNNLVANLDHINMNKDKWPSDINDAYRHMSHAVTAALYDVKVSDVGTAGAPLDQTVRPSGNTVNNR